MLTSQLTTEQRGYGEDHRRLRRELAPWVEEGSARCARCGEPIYPGQAWDLGHDDADRTRYSGPEHRNARDCAQGGNRSTSGRTARERLRAFVRDHEREPEREGIPLSDERWRVEWLVELLDVPEVAVWPRLMTLPHPAAVGSLGDEFAAWAERRMGKPLRWWQRLAATRLLEVDAAGRLVWEVALLSMARQLGKSWLLRELCLWRIHQTERFGEPQDVLHTGKDLQVCIEVQRDARRWAKGDPSYRVTEGNGNIQIEHLASGSRWLVRARLGVYGYTAGMAAVDECWKVDPEIVDEGVTPTMVEREQPQMLLISTAHRLATSLMLGRRKLALDHLEDAEGDLLIEWSAPLTVALDNVEGWRLASPHWTPRRERLVARQLAAARLGDLHDPDEPDPVESFRSQWLNQWPDRITPPKPTDPLLPAGLWSELAETLAATDTAPLFVAIEDDFGLGAAVAAVAPLDDGRLEVDGWLCTDWDAAVSDVVKLARGRQIRALRVGASLLARVPSNMTPTPKPAGASETRIGLPLLRDLAAAGAIAHDDGTEDLDRAVTAAHVRESPTGLQLVTGEGGSSHLVKALAWALVDAHDPVPTPGVF